MQSLFTLCQYLCKIEEREGKRELLLYMRKSLARIKGLGYIFWHGRHEIYHMLLGVAWAWILREWWGEFQLKWLLLSVFGSVLPDFEHLLYFVSSGKADPYTKQIKAFLKNKQWRMVTTYIEHGHKQNTNLSYHNIYIVGFLITLACVCYFIDYQAWVVLFGAMAIHYLFDIGDDFVTLGYINENWKRWGNGKKKKKHGQSS